VEERLLNVGLHSSVEERLLNVAIIGVYTMMVPTLRRSHDLSSCYE